MADTKLSFENTSTFCQHWFILFLHKTCTNKPCSSTLSGSYRTENCAKPDWHGCTQDLDMLIILRTVHKKFFHFVRSQTVYMLKWLQTWLSVCGLLLSITTSRIKKSSMEIILLAREATVWLLKFSRHNLKHVLNTHRENKNDSTEDSLQTGNLTSDFRVYLKTEVKLRCS